MTRRTALAGGLLAIAAVLSSCSSPSSPGSDVVAAANGVELSRGTLAQLVDTSTAATDPATSDPAGDASASDVRQVMTDWLRLAASGADMDGIATRTALDEQTAAASEQLAEPFLGAARDVYEKGWNESPSVCLAIIPIKEDGDSKEVMDALTNGMSFADAATQYSADPQTAAVGGVVTFQDGSHCADPKQLNPSVGQQMAGALPGDPVVVALSNGEGIIVIRPFDELSTSDKISIDPSVQQQISDEFGARMAGADIFVDARYGRWETASASVVALFKG